MAAAAVFTEPTKKNYIQPLQTFLFLLLPHNLNSASLAGFELSVWPSLGALSWCPGRWEPGGFGR